MLSRPTLFMPWQAKAHGRALSGYAVQPDQAARLSHEAVDLAQPQPGPLPDRLGGEERLEHPLGYFRWNARPGVSDGDHHEIPGGVLLPCDIGCRQRRI